MKMRKCTALLLAVLLAFSCSVPSLAADGTGKAYSPIVRAVDSALGAVHDVIFRGLQTIYMQKGIPTYEEFQKADQPQFYAGTDGTVRGNGWSAGFASGSIIPAAWRCDASGKSDPNGWCIKYGKSATGGYQHNATHIYSDQMLNLFVLSNGSDGNGNGVADLVLFVSVDGVGLTTGTVNKMRAGIEAALAPSGVTHDDILACNISATHCHNALDTQGMSILTILMKLPMCLLKIPTRSLDTAMEDTLVAQAAACAKAAFGKMETGTLSFFETASIAGSNDRLHSGVALKDWFSCFLFESADGEKTILANIARHPTTYWQNEYVLYTDFPYYMALAMRDAGYNFLFTQSAQATIYGGGDPHSDARQADADAWVKKYALTYDDWVQRYGESFTKRTFAAKSGFSEEDVEGEMKSAYCMAQFVLDSVKDAKPVAPTLRIRNRQSLLKLDNGLMALGAITGLLGESVVKADGAESGYGILVETNYMEIGDDVAILTAPGELSPALLLGSAPDPTVDSDYTPDKFWNGKTSWTGKEWAYDTLEDIVREATGDSDKIVLLFGITNDAIGYVYPDVCATQSILGAVFYRGYSNMTNNMMLATGTTSGSQLMDSYIAVVEAAVK